MILTLEIPQQGRPRCWFAFNEEDFIRKVRATRTANNAVIFQSGSARELIAARAPQPPVELLQMVATHGWDVPLYRADYLLACGHYQTEQVSEFEACVAAVAHDLAKCRVYLDEEQAMDALDNEPLYWDSSGYAAHLALREQLIALEVIADDL